MLKTEYYKTLKSGVILVRTFSDAGYYIERNGNRYTEAIDPEHLHREYVETSDPIEEDISDAEALEIITGGAANETL